MKLESLDGIVKERELRSLDLWILSYKDGDNWRKLEFTTPRNVAPEVGDTIVENALVKGGGK